MHGMFEILDGGRLTGSEDFQSWWPAASDGSISGGRPEGEGNVLNGAFFSYVTCGA